MGESQHKQKRPQNKLMQGGMKGPGKIVEVQGGRILRSTGGKDRHSKVFTFKGPRDRRVRLSAHTAIQFYDVQDRLGYDRPSKAVDWLINKAKAAIDELAELPTQNSHPPLAESSKRELQSSEDLSSSPFGFPSNGLPTLDSDALADTIKSFFPISTSPAIGFQREEDLRLSLHSFQDPILLPGHSSANYDAGSSNWAEQNQRMTPWNMAGDAAPLQMLALGRTRSLPLSSSRTPAPPSAAFPGSSFRRGFRKKMTTAAWPIRGREFEAECYLEDLKFLPDMVFDFLRLLASCKPLSLV